MRQHCSTTLQSASHLCDIYLVNQSICYNIRVCVLRHELFQCFITFNPFGDFSTSKSLFLIVCPCEKHINRSFGICSSQLIYRCPCIYSLFVINRIVLSTHFYTFVAFLSTPTSSQNNFSIRSSKTKIC